MSRPSLNFHETFTHRWRRLPPKGSIRYASGSEFISWRNRLPDSGGGGTTTQWQSQTAQETEMKKTILAAAAFSFAGRRQLGRYRGGDCRSHDRPVRLDRRPDPQGRRDGDRRHQRARRRAGREARSRSVTTPATPGAGGRGRQPDGQQEDRLHAWPLLLLVHHPGLREVYARPTSRWRPSPPTPGHRAWLEEPGADRRPRRPAGADRWRLSGGELQGQKIAVVDDKSTYGGRWRTRSPKAMEGRAAKPVLRESITAGEKDYRASWPSSRRPVSM